ncbi:hypothetical protein THAOC_03447 [Thalassiosira oceanica]|uniref:Uncharacterized protein n=1 Tax=Thalassiosira oceanica TaxID=159749 RepID=K0TCF8_THAOC|nr:hypothetical protein THAOC_03447 [Thalassiosira oceanica]|eukprot:EJK74854.1 hypothetical protein THAOC_03447 [Thalassiosira oceanica]
MTSVSVELVGLSRPSGRLRAASRARVVGAFEKGAGRPRPRPSSQRTRRASQRRSSEEAVHTAKESLGHRLRPGAWSEVTMPPAPLLLIACLVLSSSLSALSAAYSATRRHHSQAAAEGRRRTDKSIDSTQFRSYCDASPGRVQAEDRLDGAGARARAGELQGARRTVVRRRAREADRRGGRRGEDAAAAVSGRGRDHPRRGGGDGGEAHAPSLPRPAGEVPTGAVHGNHGPVDLRLDPKAAARFLPVNARVLRADAETARAGLYEAEGGFASPARIAQGPDTDSNRVREKAPRGKPAACEGLGEAGREVTTPE